MKKIIIVIGIIIAAIIVWSIVDQSRLMLWYSELNIQDDPFDNNEIDGPEQLQAVLNDCEDQRLAKEAFLKNGTLTYHDLPGYEYHNATHYIDNANCEWQENERSFEYRLVDDKEQIQRVLDSCACFAGFGGEACKLPGLSWRNDTHHIDNNTCEWRLNDIDLD